MAETGNRMYTNNNNNNNPKGKWVTATGWVQKFTGIQKVSMKGEAYFHAYFEISELKSDDKMGGFQGSNSSRSNLSDIESPIVLFFWKKKFDDKNYGIVSSLKEGQNITVSGFLNKDIRFDRPAMHVSEIETDSELFI